LAPFLFPLHMRFSLLTLLFSALPILAFCQFTNDELLGKINAAVHPEFVQIEAKYTSKTEIYLRKEAYQSFVRMHKAAAEAGIQLTIISATRSFSYQKSIWENKWDRPKYMGWKKIDVAKDILKYSSMPGSSRHHWGTDIDLNSLDNAWFDSARGKKMYDWMCENAAKYGFKQVYTSKENGRQGYNEEKWHWSYMPIAAPMLDAYNKQIKSAEIADFKGSTLADSLQIIQKYVNGIE
jgi:zinc D-Ala-D-Ala carboxypeptidase